MNDQWLFWIPPNNNKQEVRLPHTMVELPFNHVDESTYQVVGMYEKVIAWRDDFASKRVFVRFLGVAHVATVFLNGHELMTHYGGFSAFEVELTNELKQGENILCVQVDARECNNLPPFGNVVDYLAPGGIYREVELLVREPAYLEDISLQGLDLLSEPKLLVQGKVNPSNTQHRFVIEQQLSEVWVPLIDEVVSDEFSFKTDLSHVLLWSPKEPHLVRFRVSLGEEQQVITTGFREAVFKTDGFYLNGEKRDLVGLNRHQSFPYVGYAMPQSIQVYDAHILKHELQLDIVRTSHYPPSQHFLEACDELGLLVITETPGWQHLGDEAWQEHSLGMTREMVRESRHHPSIILWGTRINESIDLEAFYTKSQAIAKEMDPSRQTTGVRAHRQSQLLEDVYGYNDFSHNGLNAGLLPKEAVCGDVPYFVAEHNGHMFPTKSFDHESLRLSQLKRHATVLDAYYRAPGISGVIGWCMADYYTHVDFGSGDSICYHGVMDAFRNPKPAASVYTVRQKEPMLEALSNLSIGEYPAIVMKEIVVMSNQPEVVVEKNGVEIARLTPDRERFPALPYPPYIWSDLIGNQLEPLGYSGEDAVVVKEAVMQAMEQAKVEDELVAQVEPILKAQGHTLDDLGRFYTRYVGNWGDKAAEYRFVAGDLIVHASAVKQPSLQVIVSHQELVEGETYDVASIRIQAVDQSGTRLPYLQDSFLLEVDGTIDLIGPKIISLVGGATGCYIKSRGLGEGRLRIHSQRFGTKEWTFLVRDDRDGEVSLNRKSLDWNK